MPQHRHQGRCGRRVLASPTSSPTSPPPWKGDAEDQQILGVHPTKRAAPRGSLWDDPRDRGKASRGGKPRDNREGHREVTVAVKENKKKNGRWRRREDNQKKKGPVPVTVGTQRSAAGQTDLEEEKHRKQRRKKRPVPVTVGTQRSAAGQTDGKT